MESNVIEYIDKSLLTESQRNKIENQLNNKYENQKREIIYFNIFVFVIFCFLGFTLSLLTKGWELLIAFLLIGIGIILIRSFSLLFVPSVKNYSIIKAKLISKERQFRGFGFKGTIEDGDKKHIIDIFDEKLFNKIAVIRPKQRIYVVIYKKDVLKGIIILDITSILEGEKDG